MRKKLESIISVFVWLLFVCFSPAKLFPFSLSLPISNKHPLSLSRYTCPVSAQSDADFLGYLNLYFLANSASFRGGFGLFLKFVGVNYFPFFV